VATKFTYDTANKVFLLNPGVTSLDAKSDFYSWVKHDWLTEDSLRKYRFPIESIGGQDIGGGVTISPYYSLLYGWRLQFAAADQTINIVGNVITAEGEPPIIENAGAYHHTAVFQVSSNSLTQDTGGTGLTADEVWDFAVEGTITAAEAMRLFAAALAGKASGAGSNTIRFRDMADTKDRIVATVDSLGNRASVTRDVS